ncbi:cilia- and flagella-associated protein 263 isoform X2 [Channa argus]|uniref:cilia- and flagella-associated protein 263 isoform X2 n=1 Tax=Channa argus TaxID=215402 RepID=UPI003521F743
MQQWPIETTSVIQCTLATMEDELSVMREKDNEITAKQEELIYNQIEELKWSNAALLSENDMFERFISRLDSQDLVFLAGGETLGVAGASQAEGWASLKEAELRLTEIRKSKKEFERRLLKSMKDNRLDIKDPDKVLQYIEDKLKITQLEKFNLKNQMLMVQEKKLQQQFHQKKEMGKAEYEEIFHECDEQSINKSLDELQVNSLRVQRILSSHKEKMQSVTWESAELSNDITSRKEMLAKIEEEIQHAEEERLKAEALNQHLHRQMTDYKAPDITEYIHVKDKHKKLQQSIHTWERKVAIAEIALKTHTKAWNTQAATFTPANSDAAGARSAEHQMPVKLPHIL